MDLLAWTLPVLIMTLWALSWRFSTRLFRLYFCPLAGLVCVAGLILGLVDAFGGDSSGGVQQWADGFGSEPGIAAWIGATSLLGLGVAAALTVLTLIVEGVLLLWSRTSWRSG
ncbi:hypothetical protein ACFY36_05800 [Actinoplanes sp. NPDC000266]